ncbi:MAG: Uma2 family endonuclease [Gemmatimonadota bacterium]
MEITESRVPAGIPPSAGARGQQLPVPLGDGNRYELIEGEVYWSPPPTERHRRVCHRLGRALERMLASSARGTLLHAREDMEFPVTGEAVQPDIFLACREAQGTISGGSPGVPWQPGGPPHLVGPPRPAASPRLVVEIRSPSTAPRHRRLRRRLYERHGVTEYWLVDPERDAIEVWRFRGEPRHERFTDRLPVRLGSETIGEIDLAEVFRRG